jgi:hypothetical protein
MPEPHSVRAPVPFYENDAAPTFPALVDIDNGYETFCASYTSQG